MTLIRSNGGLVTSYNTGISHESNDINPRYASLKSDLIYALVPQLGPTWLDRDMSGHQHSPSTSRTNSHFGGKWGHHHSGTPSRTVLGNMDSIVPLKNVTLLLGYQKTDSILRNAGSFGSNGIAAVSYCNFLPKWGDGNSYFEFGGNISGTSQVGTTDQGNGPVSVGDDDWACVSGDRGMEIWQNGICVAQQSNSVARTASASNQLHFGFHAGFGSDLAVYRYLLIFNRTLSVDEIQLMSHNPMGLFEPVETLSFIDGSAIEDSGSHTMSLSQNLVDSLDPGRSLTSTVTFGQALASIELSGEPTFVTQIDGKLQQQPIDTAIRARGPINLFKEDIVAFDDIFLNPGPNGAVVQKGFSTISNDKTFVLEGTTTDATLTTLYIDGTTGDLELPTNSCWTFTASITGLRDDGSEGAGYSMQGCVRRDGSGAATIVGSITNTVIGEDDATWDVQGSVSGNNILVQVQGAALKNINWSACVTVSQTIVEA